MARVITGAILTRVFSATLMWGVPRPADVMAREIRREFRETLGKGQRIIGGALPLPPTMACAGCAAMPGKPRTAPKNAWRKGILVGKRRRPTGFPGQVWFLG